MDNHNAETDQVTYQELALRFAEVGKLFQRLGTPRAAQRLLEGLVVGDRAVFGEFVDQLDFTMLNKCHWLRDVVDRMTCTYTTTQEYQLISPMTRSQLYEYLRIVRQHPNEVLFSNGALIPGPFLDDLIKAGLAIWKSTKPTKTCIWGPVLSAPERVCL